MKKTLTLDAIDPIEIYGPANRLLEALCAYFPKLKVVARGNELLLDGAQDDIIGFNEKISMLIEKRMHKRSLSAYDVEELFEGGNAAEVRRLCSETTESRLRHGTSRRRRW